MRMADRVFNLEGDFPSSDNEEGALSCLPHLRAKRPARSTTWLLPNTPCKGDAMKDHAGRTYVLIAGAWHGGWIWRDAADGLRALGHTVTTPTLTERRHLGSNADLDTHIEDVIAHIEMEKTVHYFPRHYRRPGTVQIAVVFRKQFPVQRIFRILNDVDRGHRNGRRADHGRGAAAIQAVWRRRGGFPMTGDQNDAR
jgi:hypothetical protein